MKKEMAILALVMFFLAGCSAGQKTQTADYSTVTFAGGSLQKISVEIADTPEERAAGLMHREFLAEDMGMLFVFEEQKEQSFWMKNTLMPLDMIFVDENFEIVDVKENVQPCEADPCPSYHSNAPAKYVIEVNGGFAEKNVILVGQLVSFS